MIGRALLLLIVAAVAACSTAPPRRPAEPIPKVEDGPPVAPVDVSTIPEPTPQAEPLSEHGNPPEYWVGGEVYRPLRDGDGYRERGLASWYGQGFHGRPTSSREPFDMHKLTAAHRTLPLPSYVRVTHRANGRSVIVRVNDRGPFHGNRIIDLSWAAAAKLDMVNEGVAEVDVEVVASPAAAPVESITYRVQVGAYSTLERAEEVAARIAEAAQAGAYVETFAIENATVHRVRVGPFDELRRADEVIDSVIDAGFDSPRLIIE